MAIRYMGTKRHLAGPVREAIDSVMTKGRVLDLFSGVGAVTGALADRHPVIANDVTSFVSALSRAKFTAARRTSIQDVVGAIRPIFRTQKAFLLANYWKTVRTESAALNGDWRDLEGYMNTNPHVGTSMDLRRIVTDLANSQDSTRYQLATIYFGGGYFSVKQSIEIDSLRYAIDLFVGSPGDRDWLLGAWIATAATVINSPGHTAQYLHASSEYTQKRIRRCWTREIWNTFIDKLSDLTTVGTYDWRRRNSVTTREALSLLRSNPRNVSCVYADPPYTKDHYSRFYHVYETLYLYDFPDSRGKGRYRSDRFVTDFCIKTRVESAFRDLTSATAGLECPLVLSYPECGLLSRAGSEIEDLLHGHFRHVNIKEYSFNHSTLGGSKGHPRKNAKERIYVCHN